MLRAGAAFLLCLRHPLGPRLCRGAQPPGRGLLRADFSHFDLTRMAAGGGSDDEEEGGSNGPGPLPAEVPAEVPGARPHPHYATAAAAGAAARMSGGAVVGAM